MYYPQFPTAIHHLGVRSIVLLTLSPLTLAGTCDLHVLAMPPAFNLSHDQTLQLIFLGSALCCHSAEVCQRSRPCCQPQDHCWPWCCRSTSSSTLSGLPASPIVRLRTTVLRGSIISHLPGFDSDRRVARVCSTIQAVNPEFDLRCVRLVRDRQSDLGSLFAAAGSTTLGVLPILREAHSRAAPNCSLVKDQPTGTRPKPASDESARHLWALRTVSRPPAHRGVFASVGREA